MKKIIYIILILTLLATPALAGINTNVDVDDSGNVTLSGTSDYNNFYITIKVYDSAGKRSYYFNQDKTDSNGDFSFNFKLENDKEYTANLNITDFGGSSVQSKEFTISTNDSNINNPVVEETAYVYIEGYEGVILSRTEVEIEDGDTVEDVIERILNQEGISYRNSGGYISKIDGQAEFDKGADSGWMFKINGEFVEVGIDTINVDDGDYIKFLYTEDLGKDVGNDYTGTVKDDSIEKAENIINNKDSSDEEIAESLDLALEYLEEEIEKDEILENAQDTVDLLMDAADRVKDKDAAESMTKTALEIINVIADSEVNENEKENMKNTAVKALSSTIKMIDCFDNDEKLDEITTKLFKNTVKLKQNLSEKDEKLINKKIIKYTEKVIEKAATHKLTEDKVNIIGNKATYNIEDIDISKMKNIVSDKIAEMNNKLNENEIVSNKSFIAKVVIDSTINENSKEVEANISAKIFKKMQELSIEKMQVKSKVANFTFSNNTFESLEKTSLQAKVLDREELGEKAAQVPENSTVIDLNAYVDGEVCTKFSNAIEVEVPYVSKENEEANKLTVFLLKEDGTLEPVGGKYDSDTGKITFVTTHFSKYFVKISEKEFRDLKRYPWAEKQVEILAGKGIINGKSESEFCPSQDITRAEFSALLVRMLQLGQKTAENPFTDIKSSAWYADEVTAAYNNGIVNGKDKETFDPNGKITRQEMAVMLARVMEKQGYNKADIEENEIFSDKEYIAVWAKKGVALAVREDIVAGLENGSFAPKENAVRAEAAVMLYRLFAK